MPSNLIMITDWATDIDDVVAAVIALANEPSTDTELGLVIVDSRSTSGPMSVESVLRHYGSTAAVGAYKGALGNYPSYPYTGALLNQFGTTEIKAKTLASYPDEVVSTRTLLAASPDGTARLVNVGGMVGLANIMASPADGISGLTGIELINLKCSAVYIMAGSFPNGGAETNVNIHLASSQYVADNLLGVPVIWSGVEVGSTIRSRPPWFTSPNDALMYGFDVYGSAANNNLHYMAGARASWDPLTMDVAQRGIGSRYSLSSAGKVTFNTGGTTTFTVGGGSSNHQYLIRVATQDAISIDLVDRLALITDPVDTSRKGMYLPLTETTEKYFRDPDADGWHMLVGNSSRPAANLFPARVAAPTAGQQVLQCDGGDYIGYYGNPYFATNSWLAGTVLKPTDLTGTKYWAGHAAGAIGFWELRAVDGVLSLYSWGTTNRGTQTVITASSPLSADAWYKIVCRHTGTNLQLLVNEVLIGEAPCAQYVNPTMASFNNIVGWLDFGTARTTGGAAQTAGFIGQMATVGYWADGSDASLAAMNSKLNTYAATKGIELDLPAPPASSDNSITAVGLTMTGLTMRGITARGL